MKHTPTDPPAPLFESSSKGFNYREMARAIRPDVAAKFDGHPRADAIAAVAAGREAFIAKARLFVMSLMRGFDFTGEDAVDAAGVTGLVADEPRTWGAVFNGLAREGLIEKTGEHRPRRNGSPMPVWRVKGGSK